MPSDPLLDRHRWASALVALVLAASLSACGGEQDEITATGDERADQARDAARDAGLGDEVADFLALLARGDTATYRVRFPGPTEDTELEVTSRPPDRRVDLTTGSTTTEIRLITDGQAFTCTPADGDELACERTDALVDPPGVFTAHALEELSSSLAERVDDYTFDIDVLPVAGVEARCLVTRLRSGRQSARLGASGTLCASPEGVVLLVDQGGERLEAAEYSTEVDDDAFQRPDAPDDGETG